MAIESPNLIPTFQNISWLEPKTDWNETDKFNKEDFNRIKNNLDYLQCILKELNNTYDKKDLGNDIITYTARYKASRFNDFENTLEELNTYELSIGTKAIFSANGVFIDYKELNRIESACLELYELMCNQYSGRRTLPAKLGVSYIDNFLNL